MDQHMNILVLQNKSILKWLIAINSIVLPNVAFIQIICIESRNVRIKKEYFVLLFKIQRIIKTQFYWLFFNLLSKKSSI